MSSHKQMVICTLNNEACRSTLRVPIYWKCVGLRHKSLRLPIHKSWKRERPIVKLLEWSAMRMTNVVEGTYKQEACQDNLFHESANGMFEFLQLD